MKNRQDNFQAMFSPRSIAFVGATEKLGKWGFLIFNNLVTGGFEGELYPVNPTRPEVLGHKAYTNVRDIPGEVDLAVFTVPAKHVLPAIEDCVAKGVRAGVIISAGFKELGAEGEELEARIVETARAGNMILAGPNGQGICCPDSNLYPWMPYYFPPPGPVGVISQSGNIQSILIDGVVRSGFGVSKSVSSGNEADLKTRDYFEFLAKDDDTRVILSYLEGINDGGKFLESARRVSVIKPIVALKGGRSASGVAAARSHTGAMAVSQSMFDAACKQAGIVQVEAIHEAGIIASSFINRPLPRGRRVGILTGGGGLGVIASDACSALGLEVAPLSDDTIAKIHKMMPDWWVPGNPVDLVAGMNFHVVMPILSILMTSGEIDALMLLFIGPPRDKSRDSESENDLSKRMKQMWKTMSKMFTAFGEHLVKTMNEHQVPVYVVSNFDERDSEVSVEEIMGPNRMATFPNIRTACKAIRAMAEYYEYKQRADKN